MPRCPFYGCRWPEQSPQLKSVGGNECGLDVDHHAACAMETGGKEIDYFTCPVAMRMQTMTASFEQKIRLPDQGGFISLSEWKKTNGRRGS